LFVILLCLAAIGGGAWIWLRTRERMPLLVRVLLMLAPLSGAVATFRALGFAFSSTRFDWNAAKLAPIVAMTRGYSLYQDPKTGVMTAWIYGPVPALLFLPAAIAKRPTTAILIGELINIVVALGPAVWLLLRASSRQARWFAWLAFLVFIWITMSHESLRRAVYMIGPDAPTLALIACAIAILWRSPRSLLHMSIAACCAVLACWCKQSALPVLIVFPLYLWLSEGPIPAITQAVLIGMAAVVISVVFVLSFGASNMWFHMVTLSAGHAWRGAAQSGKFWAMSAAVQDLLVDVIPTIAMVVALLLIEWYLLPDARARDHREWFRRNPWTMLVGAALVLTPSALLGYVKIGGYVNNFSLCHYFLGLLVALLLIRLYERANDNAAIASLLLALACLGALWPMPEQFLQKRVQEENFMVIARARDNEQELVYDFAKKNPGLAYFPWNNLSTLLADGKLYHFSWGYIDRDEAHLRPSPEQIRRHLPDKVQIIGFGPRHQDELALRFLPPTQFKGTHDQLPGFTLYIYEQPLREGGW
jgi:hypothetical protein